MNEVIAVDEIVKAIAEMRRLRVWYDPGVRVIEPHAVGEGSDGQLLLRAYQTEGASASGEHEHWNLLRVDRIKHLEPLSERFEESRPGYKRGDRAMKRRIIREI